MPNTWREGGGEESRAEQRPQQMFSVSTWFRPHRAGQAFFMTCPWAGSIIRLQRSYSISWLLTRRLSRAKLVLGKSFQTWKETPSLLGPSWLFEFAHWLPYERMCSFQCFIMPQTWKSERGKLLIKGFRGRSNLCIESSAHPGLKETVKSQRCTGLFWSWGRWKSLCSVKKPSIKRAKA